MRTIKEFLNNIFSEANWDYGELKESCPELIEDIEKETREFLQEAIKADRENVAEHATTKEDYAPSCSDHTPYRGPCGSCGSYNTYDVLVGATVDKDSIVNAPQIELL